MKCITKKELRILYDVSPSTLRRYLNSVPGLKLKKYAQIIPPLELKKIFKKLGDPRENEN